MAGIVVSELEYAHAGGEPLFFDVGFGFEGTVVTVSHDRAFLARMSRILLIADDGAVFALPDYDVAMSARARPDDIDEVALAKPLS
jgi:hypothetical protein